MTPEPDPLVDALDRAVARLYDITREFAHNLLCLQARRDHHEHHRALRMNRWPVTDGTTIWEKR